MYAPLNVGKLIINPFEQLQSIDILLIVTPVDSRMATGRTAERVTSGDDGKAKGCAPRDGLSYVIPPLCSACLLEEACFRSGLPPSAVKPTHGLVKDHAHGQRVTPVLSCSSGISSRTTRSVSEDWEQRCSTMTFGDAVCTLRMSSACCVFHFSLGHGESGARSGHRRRPTQMTRRSRRSWTSGPARARVPWMACCSALARDRGTVSVHPRACAELTLC
jgi:hypothetical protein